MIRHSRTCHNPSRVTNAMIGSRSKERPSWKVVAVVTMGFGACWRWFVRRSESEVSFRNSADRTHASVTTNLDASVNLHLKPGESGVFLHHHSAKSKHLCNTPRA